MNKGLMIIKFQKPLLGGNQVLIYDEHETVLDQIPFTKDINKLFGKRDKMYRVCKIDRKGILHIGDEVDGSF